MEKIDFLAKWTIRGMVRKMAKVLYTIGYEKLDFEQFLKRIENAEVKTIVDVREYPKSRKKGFSKRQMATYFEQNRIAYVHMRELGSPPDLREDLRKDGNYKLFFRKYIDYLTTQEQSLNLLADLIRQSTTCIFCYEDNILECHRKSIAAYLNALNGEELEIVHL